MDSHQAAHRSRSRPRRCPVIAAAVTEFLGKKRPDSLRKNAAGAICRLPLGTARACDGANFA
jgi:hypothetical protein